MDYNPKVRIWVAWRSQAYQVQVRDTTKQLMRCKVIQVRTRKAFCITFVYGMNTIAMRQPLWRDLRSIAGHMQMAWGVVGDFNATLYPEERLGGEKINPTKLTDFATCLEECEL